MIGVGALSALAGLKGQKAPTALGRERATPQISTAQKAAPIQYAFLPLDFDERAEGSFEGEIRNVGISQCTSVTQKWLTEAISFVSPFQPTLLVYPVRNPLANQRGINC